MPLPEFFDNFPSLDLPFPPEVVSTRVLRSDAGMMVAFTFHRDVDLPAHSHKGQWGTVLAGSVALTIDGQTTVYRPGQSYEIGAGDVHAGSVPAGTVVIDVFEESDRYPLKT